VPVVRDFYVPLSRIATAKSKELRPADISLSPADAGIDGEYTCSEGHPMVVRAGRFGEYLACSRYPEHKESRPLPTPNLAAPGADGSAGGKQPDGVGEPCPECGATDGGTLVARRGRFGPFVGCARYPACRYIKKDGPPPPARLPFDAPCPRCGQGILVARRARRAGSVFHGCSRYPTCRYTTSRTPMGALHDADGAAVAATDDPAAGICLACGAPVAIPAGPVAPLTRLAGGAPDPAALERPRRPTRAASGGRRTTGRPAAGRTKASGAARGGTGGGASRGSRGSSRGAARGDRGGSGEAGGETDGAGPRQ
jgi:ssDNA-binding Zn-finger/Zn-ribbon topoisomerase 1